MSRKLTTGEWITKSKIVHGDRYDYSKSIYKTTKDKLIITCRVHGDWSTTPFPHTKGVGCPTCGKIKQGNTAAGTTKEFIIKAMKVHKGKYSYKKSKYTRSHVKLTITCPDHGDFKQDPSNHLAGHGCPKCCNASTAIRVSGCTEEFITKATQIHGQSYSYHKVDYKAAIEPVVITCPDHGDFNQKPNVHLSGSGCPACGAMLTRIKLEEEIPKRFIEKARLRHGDKYSYSEVEYIEHKTKVKIWCKEHQEFFYQTPDRHIQGTGCKKCSNTYFKPEEDLSNFVEEFFDIKRNNRKILAGRELDIYIPSKNIAIEFNGNIWHSEKFSKDPKWHMLRKQRDCEALGIRLIHVAEKDDPVIVKKTLSHILGIDTERYGARNTKVNIISSNNISVKNFLDNNHLQGSIPGCVAICLMLNETIVSCMLFSRVTSIRGAKVTKGHWELRRMSSCCRVVGGASKMLTHFLSHHHVKNIISYSDNRWFTGNMYDKLGFSLIKTSNPDYKYIRNGMVVINKNKLTRKNMRKLEGFDFDPAKSEHENALANGYYRLYDCGKKKWELIV